MLSLAVRAGESPRLVVILNGDALDGYRLHHLAEGTVGQEHRRNAILLSYVKCVRREAYHLLYARGSNYEEVIVPVSAAAGCLEIVGLGRLDTAETRAAALHVNDERRKVAACHVADAFFLQRNSGARGARHNSLAGGSNADAHVDGCDLALRLKECSADFGHALCHVCRHLGLGCDRISEVESAACHNSGFRDRFVTLHQNLVCHVLNPFLP